MSRFDGSRIYNGCPDSTLQKRIDYLVEQRGRLKLLGAYVTYFPVEETWSAWSDNHKQISGDHSTQLGAILEGIAILSGNPTN